MKKSGNELCIDHIHYKVYKTEKGSIYLCENGILGNGNIHIKWLDLFDYLDDIGYKIIKKDDIK